MIKRKVKNKVICSFLSFFIAFNHFPSAFSAPSIPESGITISKTLGKITEHFKGDDGRTLVLIQDAHSNEEAQMNISQILTHLAKKYGMKTAYLEGAETDLYSKHLSMYPSRTARKKAASFLLRKGKISGPEYAAVVEMPELRLHGVEDKKIYEENRKAYLDALASQKENLATVGEIKRWMNMAAIQVLPGELFHIMRKKENFFAQRGSLDDYLDRLLKWAHEKNVDLDVFPQLKDYSSLKSEERKGPEIQEVLERIDHGIFDELENLERFLCEKTLTSEEKDFVESLRRVGVLEQLIKFAWTRQDAQYFFEHRARFQMKEFEKELKAYQSKLRIEADLPKNLIRLDSQIEKVQKFYKLALKRDGVLISKTLSDWKSEEKVTALVAGGFHTPEFERMLREKRISFITVLPLVKNSFDFKRQEALYQASLKQDPEPFGKFIFKIYKQSERNLSLDPLYQLSAWRTLPETRQVASLKRLSKKKVGDRLQEKWLASNVEASAWLVAFDLASRSKTFNPQATYQRLSKSHFPEGAFFYSLLLPDAKTYFFENQAELSGPFLRIRAKVVRNSYQDLAGKSLFRRQGWVVEDVDTGSYKTFRFMFFPQEAEFTSPRSELREDESGRETLDLQKEASKRAFPKRIFHARVRSDQYERDKKILQNPIIKRQVTEFLKERGVPFLNENDPVLIDVYWKNGEPDSGVRVFKFIHNLSGRLIWTVSVDTQNLQAGLVVRDYKELENMIETAVWEGVDPEQPEEGTLGGFQQLFRRYGRISTQTHEQGEIEFSQTHYSVVAQRKTPGKDDVFILRVNNRPDLERLELTFVLSGLKAPKGVKGQPHYQFEFRGQNYSVYVGIEENSLTLLEEEPAVEDAATSVKKEKVKKKRIKKKDKQNSQKENAVEAEDSREQSEAGVRPTPSQTEEDKPERKGPRWWRWVAGTLFVIGGGFALLPSNAPNQPGPVGQGNGDQEKRFIRKDEPEPPVRAVVVEQKKNLEVVGQVQPQPVQVQPDPPQPPFEKEPTLKELQKEKLRLKEQKAALENAFRVTTQDNARALADQYLMQLLAVHEFELNKFEKEEPGNKDWESLKEKLAYLKEYSRLWEIFNAAKKNNKFEEAFGNGLQAPNKDEQRRIFLLLIKSIHQNRQWPAFTANHASAESQLDFFFGYFETGKKKGLWGYRDLLYVYVDWQLLQQISVLEKSLDPRVNDPEKRSKVEALKKQKRANQWIWGLAWVLATAADSMPADQDKGAENALELREKHLKDALRDFKAQDFNLEAGMKDLAAKDIEALILRIGRVKELTRLVLEKPKPGFFGDKKGVVLLKAIKEQWEEKTAQAKKDFNDFEKYPQHDLETLQNELEDTEDLRRRGELEREIQRVQLKYEVMLAKLQAEKFEKVLQAWLLGLISNQEAVDFFSVEGEQGGAQAVIAPDAATTARQALAHPWVPIEKPAVAAGEPIQWSPYENRVIDEMRDHLIVLLAKEKPPADANALAELKKQVRNELETYLSRAVQRKKIQGNLIERAKELDGAKLKLREIMNSLGRTRQGPAGAPLLNPGTKPLTVQGKQFNPVIFGQKAYSTSMILQLLELKMFEADRNAPEFEFARMRLKAIKDLLSPTPNAPVPHTVDLLYQMHKGRVRAELAQWVSLQNPLWLRDPVVQQLLYEYQRDVNLILKATYDFVKKNQNVPGLLDWYAAQLGYGDLDLFIQYVNLLALNGDLWDFERDLAMTKVASSRVSFSQRWIVGKWIEGEFPFQVNPHGVKDVSFHLWHAQLGLPKEDQIALARREAAIILRGLYTAAKFWQSLPIAGTEEGFDITVDLKTEKVKVKVLTGRNEKGQPKFEEKEIPFKYLSAKVDPRFNDEPDRFFQDVLGAIADGKEKVGSSIPVAYEQALQDIFVQLAQVHQLFNAEQAKLAHSRMKDQLKPKFSHLSDKALNRMALQALIYMKSQGLDYMDPAEREKYVLKLSQLHDSGGFEAIKKLYQIEFGEFLKPEWLEPVLNQTFETWNPETQRRFRAEAKKIMNNLPEPDASSVRALVHWLELIDPADGNLEPVLKQLEIELVLIQQGKLKLPNVAEAEDWLLRNFFEKDPRTGALKRRDKAAILKALDEERKKANWLLAEVVQTALIERINGELHRAMELSKDRDLSGEGGKKFSVLEIMQKEAFIWQSLQPLLEEVYGRNNKLAKMAEHEQNRELVTALVQMMERSGMSNEHFSKLMKVAQHPVFQAQARELYQIFNGAESQDPRQAERFLRHLLDSTFRYASDPLDYETFREGVVNFVDNDREKNKNPKDRDLHKLRMAARQLAQAAENNAKNLPNQAQPRPELPSINPMVETEILRDAFQNLVWKEDGSVEKELLKIEKFKRLIGNKALFGKVLQEASDFWKDLLGRENVPVEFNEKNFLENPLVVRLVYAFFQVGLDPADLNKNEQEFGKAVEKWLELSPAVRGDAAANKKEFLKKVLDAAEILPVDQTDPENQFLFLIFGEQDFETLRKVIDELRKKRSELRQASYFSQEQLEQLQRALASKDNMVKTVMLNRLFFEIAGHKLALNLQVQNNLQRASENSKGLYVIDWRSYRSTSTVDKWLAGLPAKKRVVLLLPPNLPETEKKVLAEMAEFYGDQLTMVFLPSSHLTWAQEAGLLRPLFEKLGSSPQEMVQFRLNAAMLADPNFGAFGFEMILRSMAHFDVIFLSDRPDTSLKQIRLEIWQQILIRTRQEIRAYATSA